MGALRNVSIFPVSLRRGDLIAQGVAMYDGECLELRSVDDSSLICVVLGRRPTGGLLAGEVLPEVRIGSSSPADGIRSLMETGDLWII